MKTQDAIAHYGSIKKLADALGIWPQAIYKWGSHVPQGRAYQLQFMTNGKLRIESKAVADDR